MKKILKCVFIFTIIILYIFYVVNYSYYIKEQVLYSFDIWIRYVIPSLLPTFILVDAFYAINIPYYFYKFFHINIIYIISIFCGSPTNAILINNSTFDKEKLLASTKYISLLFLLNNLKKVFSRKVVFVLITSNVIANFIIIFITKPQCDISYNSTGKVFDIISNIKKYMESLISILGSIIIFNTLPVRGINNEYIKCFMLSLMEITGFFNYIYQVSLPFIFKFFCSIIAISSCGLCIECQIKSIINDTSINYKHYLYWRFIHLILYILLCVLGLFIL